MDWNAPFAQFAYGVNLKTLDRIYFVKQASVAVRHFSKTLTEFYEFATTFYFLIIY